MIRGCRGDRRARCEPAAARAPAGRNRASQPQQRPGLASARDRARARAARGGGPGRDRWRTRGARGCGVRSLRGSEHPRRREHRARGPGRHLPPHRELSRLSRRDQRQRADQPRDRAGAQVRGPDRDALPRARARGRQRFATGSRSRRITRSSPGRCSSPPARTTGASRLRPPGRVRGPERLLRRRPAGGAVVRR